MLAAIILETDAVKARDVTADWVTTAEQSRLPSIRG